MVQKLSSFLGTSFSESPVDSASIVRIIAAATIKLDSGTSGNYIRTLIGSAGLTVTAAGHSLDGVIQIDSDIIATRTGTQTLTGKTLNLSNNTVVTTLGQLSAAVSGDNVVGTQATQTIANKTLTSPTINGGDINGPIALNDVTTFGLRDVTTTDFETLILSNSSSPALSADRTLTFDVNNANRGISLTGDLTLAGSFITSGAHTTTITTTGNTGVTLPTSGTLISKSSASSITAGVYGSGSLVPVITIDAQGFVDSAGVVAVAGVASTTFDSADGILTIGTADGASFNATTLLTTGKLRSFYGAAIFTEMLARDGAGTNLDADKLDGQHGAHYRIDVYNASGSLLN